MHENDLFVVNGVVVFKEFAHLLCNSIHGRDVFISQTNICQDSAVIHLSRIDDAIGGKDSVGDIHRSSVKGA